MYVGLILGVCLCSYDSLYSATHISSIEISQQKVETTTVTFKKGSKKQRLKAKFSRKLQQFVQHASADFYLWMGLYCLGLGLCLALFSATLGGIVGAAGFACLFIWCFIKLGAL